MAAATKKEKKRKEEAYPWKASASSGHITNLKQSILETFDIYELYKRFPPGNFAWRAMEEFFQNSINNDKRKVWNFFTLPNAFNEK